MAITGLRIDGENELSAYIRDGGTGAVLRKKFGLTASVPALAVDLTYGTTSAKANWMYYASRTVAATTADNLDLSGSLTDGLGNTISATKLKLAVIAIASPDGTKSLRVGPRGVANAAQLNFGGVAATDYQTVTHWWWLYEPVAGYTITAATADIFGVYNPGAGSVTYSVLLAGV
jgi:hypothetical protein